MINNIYFGLDLGSKTCGIAMSASGIIASDLTTIYFEEENYEACLEKLMPLIDTYKVTHIVLGYPKHMNNDVGIRGKISEAFKVLLESKKAVKVVLWDERLSTSSALKILSDSKKKKQKQKHLKDQMAAQLILQNYLDYQGR